MSTPTIDSGETVSPEVFSFKGSFVDSCMPSIPPVYRVTDVPLDDWVRRGVRLLMLDLEDNMTEPGNPDLIPEYVEYVRSFHGDNGIPFLVGGTNRPVKNDNDRRLVAGWGRQLGADLMLTPSHPSEGKPSPVMNYKAMGRFGVAGAQTGSIGDKATADMRAANFAGIENRAWTRPFSGSERHIGDRIVRDPAEQVLRVIAHLRLNPLLDPNQAEEVVPYQVPGRHPAVEVIEERHPDGEDMIAGWGVEDIKLSEELLQGIPRPVLRRALEDIQTFYDDLTEKPRQNLQDFLYEHGRKTGDMAVFARVMAACSILVVKFMPLERELKRQIQAALTAVGYTLDGFDGLAVRGHKDGPTKEGAKKDDRADKLLEACVDLGALVPLGYINKAATVIPILRNAGITMLREPFNDRGIDTRSTKLTKISTLSVAGLQIATLRFGDRYPNQLKVARNAAVALKVATAAHAPFAWIERHEREQHAKNNATRLASAS